MKRSTVKVDRAFNKGFAKGAAILAKAGFSP